MPDQFLIEVDGPLGGRRWNGIPEQDCDRMNFKNVCEDIRSGQHENVKRVIRLNVEEGVARDVSEDVALEIISRIAADGDDLEDMPRGSCRDFLEEHASNALNELIDERNNWRSDYAEHNTMHRAFQGV